MSKLPEIYLDEDGIFHEYHYDKIISKSCAMFVAEERNNLTKTKHPLLVKFKDLEGYSPETRDLTLDFVLKSVSALAYCVDLKTEEGQRTKKVIDSFFAITPWPIPVEIFTNENEALTWLKKHVNSNS
ncbi:MAG: hypothetical protein OEW99_01830 [Gammaproteobacteria bacterium]|nr:hypothetical protein [Gammaproteobacteria bacterium]